LLRGLGRLDVYPGDDVGARNKLRTFLCLPEAPDYATVSRVTAAWDPFAGMVYFHLLLDGLAERGSLSLR
jgi:DNA-3-methyladenine glycosylase II